MKDFASKEEVIKHLGHITNTIGINLDNPFSAIKTKYTISLYYLGNMFYHLDTRCFDMEIDEFLKEGETNESKRQD